MQGKKLQTAEDCACMIREEGTSTQRLLGLPLRKLMKGEVLRVCVVCSVVVAVRTATLPRDSYSESRNHR